MICGSVQCPDSRNASASREICVVVVTYAVSTPHISDRKLRKVLRDLDAQVRAVQADGATTPGDAV